MEELKNGRQARASEQSFCFGYHFVFLCLLRPASSSLFWCRADRYNTTRPHAAAPAPRPYVGPVTIAVTLLIESRRDLG